WCRATLGGRGSEVTRGSRQRPGARGGRRYDSPGSPRNASTPIRAVGRWVAGRGWRGRKGQGGRVLGSRSPVSGRLPDSAADSTHADASTRGALASPAPPAPGTGVRRGRQESVLTNRTPWREVDADRHAHSDMHP